jgi:hypothetical protein
MNGKHKNNGVNQLNQLRQRQKSPASVAIVFACPRVAGNAQGEDRMASVTYDDGHRGQCMSYSRCPVLPA